MTSSRLVLALAALLLGALPAEAACDIDPTPCSGCGCKGGPGWRHLATGRCVGFRDLAAKCGDPPSPSLCSFENAPGTGANRACALAPARAPAAGPPVPAGPLPTTPH